MSDLEQVLQDVTLLWEAPYDTRVSFSVTNIFDEDPPFARTDLNYDALTADPLGRTFKIGISKTF